MYVLAGSTDLGGVDEVACIGGDGSAVVGVGKCSKRLLLDIGDVVAASLDDGHVDDERAGSCWA